MSGCEAVVGFSSDVQNLRSVPYRAAVPPACPSRAALHTLDISPDLVKNSLLGPGFWDFCIFDE